MCKFISCLTLLACLLLIAQWQCHKMGSGKVMEHACLSLVTHVLILVSVLFSSFICRSCAHYYPFLAIATCMCIKFSVCIGLFYFLLFVCVVGVGCSGVHAEVRGHIYRVSSLLPLLHGFWEPNSGCWALPTEPFCQLSVWVFFSHWNIWGEIDWCNGYPTSDKVLISYLSLGD